MIVIDRRIAPISQGVRMILQVHDELVFEVTEDYMPKVHAQIRQDMERVVRLKVPLVVEVGVGENWDKAH
jgi:DNA polymerase-1